jgi:hypothetical protein
MTITIEMPPVQSCSVTDCAYNVDSDCHAKAITIGDGVHPGCDTYINGAGKHPVSGSSFAGVGACKVSSCVHNQDLECAATGIEVGIRNDMADCLTYTAR